ncbi:MAG: hypothetical protein VW313_11640 [Gammaproteobacteria bacterium]
MILLNLVRINLVGLLASVAIILPGQAEADRHCSVGIGFIEIGVAELNNSNEAKDTCSQTQEKVADWLTTIVEDFEVCGCSLPKSVSTDVKRSTELSCDDSKLLQLEILNNLDQVAKTACGY